MTIRQQLIDCLEYSQAFEQIGNEVSQWRYQIVVMQNEENRCDGRMSFFRSAFLFAIGFFVLITVVGIAMYGFGDMMDLLLTSFVCPDTTDEIGICITVVVMVLGSFFWLLFARKLRRMQRDHQIRRQQIDTKILELQQRYQALLQDAHDDGAFEVVPADYFGSEMIEYCISVIDRKLATTLREAFWLLEQELQRQKQRTQQQMMFDAQAAQMERLTNAVHVNTVATVLSNQERNR